MYKASIIKVKLFDVIMVAALVSLCLCSGRRRVMEAVFMGCTLDCYDHWIPGFINIIDVLRNFPRQHSTCDEQQKQTSNYEVIYLQRYQIWTAYEYEFRSSFRQMFTIAESSRCTAGALININPWFWKRCQWLRIIISSPPIREQQPSFWGLTQRMIPTERKTKVWTASQLASEQIWSPGMRRPHVCFQSVFEVFSSH